MIGQFGPAVAADLIAFIRSDPAEIDTVGGEAAIERAIGRLAATLAIDSDAGGITETKVKAKQTVADRRKRALPWPAEDFTQPNTSIRFRIRRLMA